MLFACYGTDPRTVAIVFQFLPGCYFPGSCLAMEMKIIPLDAATA